MREQRLAVDLGTANTVVFQQGKGVVLFEPSVVAVDLRTGAVEAGRSDAIGRTPPYIRTSRPLRNGAVADPEATQWLLADAIRRIAGRFRFRRVVLVCVASGSTPVERAALREAAIAAGASRAYLIEQPLAAAIGADLPVTESAGCLVVDVGGGTSQAAIAALGGVTVSHSIAVGGFELDAAICRALRERKRLLIGREQAEALKIRVGSAVAGLAEARTAEVAGRDLTTGLLVRVVVDAEEILAALEPLLRKIVDNLAQLLETMPPELAPDVSDRGLMLVGGGALLRGLDVLLRRETGLPVSVADEPLTAVARGAGRVLDEI